MSILKVFEAFSGYGSQTLAMKRLNINYEVVGISDNSKYAEKAYKLLHKEDIKNYGDITSIDVDSVDDFDMLTCTFPCQSISKEGNKEGLKEGSGTTSSLIWECRKLIERKKPKYIFLENVENLISKAHKDEFDKWRMYLTDQGYTNFYKILNSKELGIPQNRSRVFMISFLEKVKFKFPDLIPNGTSINHYFDDIGVPSFYLKENSIKINENLQITNDMAIIQSGIISLVDGEVRIKQATKKGYIELKVPGVCDLTYPNSKTRRGRVQGEGKICPTITATKNMLYVVNRDYSVRELTLTERMRLMGLNEKEINSLITSDIPINQLYKLIGNSIVVDVIVEIYKCFLQEYINIRKYEVII